jgi:hypothetical protein
MLVSPFLRSQQAVRDPFIGLRRAAACIFSLCLACVALSSLDVFKQRDDSLAESTSSKLGGILLFHPLAPKQAAGNDRSSLKPLKTRSTGLDRSLLDSAKGIMKVVTRDKYSFDSHCCSISWTFCIELCEYIHGCLYPEMTGLPYQGMNTDNLWHKRSKQ